jgi:hypothetical protein
MFRRHVFRTVKIGYRSSNAQHAIMCASRKIHPAYRHFKRSFTGIIKRAQCPKLSRRNLRIVKTAYSLRFSRLLDTFSDFGG